MADGITDSDLSPSLYPHIQPFNCAAPPTKCWMPLMLNLAM